MQKNSFSLAGLFAGERLWDKTALYLCVCMPSVEALGGSFVMQCWRDGMWIMCFLPQNIFIHTSHQHSSSSSGLFYGTLWLRYQSMLYSAIVVMKMDEPG